MTGRMRQCAACGKYTMKKKCSCGGAAETSHPARFSFEDRYAKYRRRMKYGGGSE
ncbi:ribosome biogenesis protein [Candidatus Micrarchaeota archaeon CG10_big_fil_rev_8_21_14_0_10_59_7]|nr:MAG: ribosome biogenesis protein [Candidatus Micrarchaeota archaeon CG10_big_fil_rev_8_21_14_0_10_59_7]